MSVVITATLTWYFTSAKQSKKTEAPSRKEPTTINWQLLQQLDYKRNYAPPNVKELHGKLVRIAGFIVPLTDNVTVLKEFLLVPDPQSCIHVPPPPPNLIVYVKLKKAIPFKRAFNPAWVSGTIHLLQTHSQFGYASYRMVGRKLTKYK